MKFLYQFRNLLGTVYRKGDILFTKDGNTVISPVGNRITFFDLKNNRSFTLPVESKFNYSCLDISPDGRFLIAINDVGEAHVISLISMSIIHKYWFKAEVFCLKFSPNGRYMAVGKSNKVYVFRTPGEYLGEFNPFVIERVFQGHYDDITSITWSNDSRILGIGSKDGSVKVFALPMLQRFRVCTLGSHSYPIVAAFFDDSSLDITTLSSNGKLCIWEANFEAEHLVDINDVDEGPTKKSKHEEIDIIEEYHGDDTVTTVEENEGKEFNNLHNITNDFLSYRKMCHHFLNNKTSLTSASYSVSLHLLVTGYSDGSFLLHELPDVSLIHSLNISTSCISRVAISPNGDWIALACEEQGQLLVWEWQSETYIMKQQGHSSSISMLCYSPDGLYIATGGEDGKVKLWNTVSGFCFVTFDAHTSGVTSVKFASHGKFVISSSLDGTVRAHDMTRYRNFRTLTSTKPVQFVCVAIDSSCEFVAAGCQDVFDIHLWSMKLGRLLEILSGHEGPVVSLAFNPSFASTELVSVSWDKSLRVWNAIDTSCNNEVIKFSTDALCIEYRPDGKEVALSTQDGQILFFDPKLGKQNGSIQGRNDLGSGRTETDLIKAQTSLKCKAFSSLCYSADGQFLIAGGRSKNVCIYDVSSKMLVKKFEVTQNRSLDAVDDFVHKKAMSEFGNKALIEDREDRGATIKLPGVKKGDMASRRHKPEINVFCLKFSPNGKDWVAATTEGLLIYSLDDSKLFDPFNLEEDITPEAINEALMNENYSEALNMCLRLNLPAYIKKVIECTPVNCIDLCVTSLNNFYCEKLLNYLAKGLETSHHLQFYLTWLKSIFGRSNNLSLPNNVLLKRNLTKIHHDLSKVCEFNKYSIKYFLKVGTATPPLLMENS